MTDAERCPTCGSTRSEGRALTGGQNMPDGQHEYDYCDDPFHDTPDSELSVSHSMNVGNPGGPLPDYMSEPTPDEDTANFTMPAMITEAKCNRRVEDAKREQMETDCDLLSEMACMERRRESQALRGAVTSIRVAWGMEHK